MFGEQERGIKTEGGGDDIRCASGDIWLTGTLGNRFSNLLLGDSSNGDIEWSLFINSKLIWGNGTVGSFKGELDGEGASSMAFLFGCKVVRCDWIL